MRTDEKIILTTVAIMILLWGVSNLTITAHASSGLVTRRYRTDLAKGEVVEDIIVDDEGTNALIVDEEFVDEIIVDDITTADDIVNEEEAAEPEEPEEEIEIDVEKVISINEENTEEITAPIATPSDAEEPILTVDNNTEEIEEEENKNETEVQIP